MANKTKSVSDEVKLLQEKVFYFMNLGFLGTNSLYFQ